MFRPILRASPPGTCIYSISRQVRTLATKKQHSLPAAYYRGGTSRAVFFKQDDLPHDRKQWAHIFRSVIGTPDPYGRQLDGMGGGISSLSKVCVVGESTHPDADVDYTFIALGVETPEVDYSSNCGNMISAVGPYAVDTGLFSTTTTTTGVCGSQSVTVRIHNTNTGKIIHSSFPIIDGEAAASGDFSIDGVAGTAARVQLDFVDPAGSRTGKLLPTGQIRDIFDGITATCIDVGNPCVFVQAAELGVPRDMTPDEITAHPDLLLRLDSIRRQAGVKMGLAETPEKVPGSVPKICIVSSPTNDARAREQNQTAEQVDLVARALSVGQPHKAVPITVALALAAAARLSGTTVNEVTITDPVNNAGITIGHASGNLLVEAIFNKNGEVNAATVFRTARRLFEGRIFWKNES
ncbi:hypothetical protein AJ79_02548 [Helicocarpus griseus UAMH5409]|uniref:PrpF protein n=1 Tax=Helicocarpus griseus UAMH5409 TaxID=1447875 RepID=A0A2B7Y2B2_9EURO|nr:hypothetical protein AJ79_02548 [Helicocarpus griseus UAMH5409]